VVTPPLRRPVPFRVIDPHDITGFERSDAELEEFALFAPAVAGKTASQISLALDAFLEHDESEPLARVRRYDLEGSLTQRIQSARLGKWRTLTSCYRALASGMVDLRTCTLEELEALDGIGPKTSRFFVMHTRRDQRCAVLDTHVLRYLRAQGYDVPRTTPQTSASYRRVETIFLEHAASIGRTDLAAFDLEIWSTSTERSKRVSRADI
jgi:hypothetical protein